MISGMRVLYDAEDAMNAGALIVRALDGRITEQDARRAAHAAFQSVGMERKRAAPPAQLAEGDHADPR